MDVLTMAACGACNGRGKSGLANYTDGNGNLVAFEPECVTCSGSGKA